MPRPVRALGAIGILLAVSLLHAPSTRGDALVDGAGDLSPIQPQEWSYDLAAHLLERAGFGGTPAEIERLAAMSPRDAVRSLVYYQEVADVELPPFRESGIFPAPDWSPARTSQAFRHILFGTLDGLPPAERARLMHPSMTGVEPEDARAAATDKQAVVDGGTKTVLGRTGALDGEDVVDVILEQEACSRFIAAKLYRFFVRDAVDPATLEQAAAALRAADYEIAPFLERLLLSRDFYSAPSYATQIKSPVELVVSAWRKLGLEQAPTWPSFAAVTGGLGQRLFQPPNVKGWDGGRTWINPSTLLQRQNALRYLLFPEEVPVIADAHLQGSRRLSGDFIHEQFIAGAAIGDFRTFPRGDGMAMGGGMAGGGAGATGGAAMPSAAEETAKLSGEDFNLFRGVFNGAWRSWQRIGPEPRLVARFRVSDWLADAGASDAEGAVDYLLRRFLRVPLDAERRRSLAAFLEGQLDGEPLSLQDGRHETALRELLHLILSTPENQLV